MHVKVLFELDNEDGDVDIESIWVTPVKGGYKIDNIPFYAKEVALNDIISATPTQDGMLMFSGIVETSGHSTIRLWFNNESDVDLVRNNLKNMGCSSELDLSRLVAVDIPPGVKYKKLRKYFEQQENVGIFEYEEACLGQ